MNPAHDRSHAQFEVTPSVRRQFQAMDYLVLVRSDPSTTHRTLRYYVRLGRQYGLSDVQIAAGLGRTQEQVAEILTGGSH